MLISAAGRRGCRRARPGPAAALVCGLLGATGAHGADCSVSTSGVAFGVYDPTLTTPTDSTGALTVRCSYVSGGGTQISYVVSLSPGSSGSYAQRLLRSGTSVLNYNLFDSATRTRIWGNGTGGTGVASGSFTVGPGVGNNLREASHPVYGRIPAQQSPAIGSYTDTIVVTLTF